jgi:hypothetical protein
MSLRWPLVAACLLLSASLCASTPTAWEMTSYQDFLKGRISGLALSKEGTLTPGFSPKIVFDPQEAQVWSAARAADGTVVLGTASRGRLYQVSPAGTGTLLWTAPEPAIFAVAAEPSGSFLAATSPNGKIYRIQRNGQAAVLFDPQTRYLWSLEVAPDGTIYAGSGDGGRIFRISPSGRGEIYGQTGQTHVTALALDPQGRLLAGTEPGGILFRFAAAQQPVALYDSPLAEIRRILPQPDGSILIAAMGATSSQRFQSAAPLPATATPTVQGPAISITITDADAARNAIDFKAPQPAASAATTPAAAVTDFSTPATEKSAVVRLLPDLTPVPVWSSKDENAYDLQAAGPNVRIATDSSGRVYEVDPRRAVSLLSQTEGTEWIRLLDGELGVTALAGRLFRFTTQDPVTYESPVHDAGHPARWGRLTPVTSGSGPIRFQVRSGNSASPGTGWSDWKNAETPLTVGFARYLQWKAEWDRGSTASLHGVTVSYQSQNRAPEVRSLTASASYDSAPTTKIPTSTGSTATYSVTVTDTAETTSSTPAGTPSQTMARQTVPRVILIWVAEDEDGDRLRYDLHVRGLSETVWRPVKLQLSETTYSFDPEVLGEGRFLFRVRASDAASNSPETSLETDFLSAPVLLDFTPPIVDSPSIQRGSGGLDVTVTARDAVSPLRRCEVSVNGGPWQILTAADGIADSLEETFQGRIPGEVPAGSVLVFRVQDAADNPALRRVSAP